MPAASLGRRRPRPVADAPATDGAALAKAWLVELVAVAPLARAQTLPGPRFAEDAPALCAAVGAALASDAAFDDLEPGGALAPLAAGTADLAGARDALEAVTALESLRAVAWAILVDALDRPTPGQVAELSDRLGAVIAALTAATLEAPGPAGPLRPGDRGPLAAVLRSTPPGEPRDPAPPPPPPPPVAEEPLPPPVDFAASAREVVDASAFRSQPPWTTAIERRVARHREDGLPFAVLCLEIVDAERVAAADIDGSAARAFEAAEGAVLGELRPADALVRERPGRYWLTAPDTDGDEARTLAHRIATRVQDAAAHQGTPLQVAVGLAACPSDGVDAAALEGRAEEGLFAAQAAGLRVAGPLR
jgi:GGDEF domain-containing protein